MVENTTFGAWLKRRRRQLDLTQKGLAFQAGCSVGTIRKIEADERRPSRQLATLLARHLDVPPEQREPFIAFARAEPYTAAVSFPILAPVEKQAYSIPALPQETSSQEIPPQPVKNNLPLETTPFVGREPELVTLDDLFTNLDNRLVTLVGPGGIGKTRLAMAYAKQLAAQSQYPNGVFFVNLATLTLANQLILALAETLNLRIQGGARDKRSPREQLLDYVRDRRLFLLLDNFEHLLAPVHPQDIETEIDGAALVAEILQAAPEIRILVTSRERLNLHMEQLFAIDGLAFPDWETTAPEAGSEDVAEYTAVQLFLQAAHRSQPGFSLETREELIALVRICRLVGGMPLALELAASWIDTLSLVDIAVELQRGLDLLETELRDVPQRQHSVRATFDTSWRKLNEREQSIFAQLSIFRDGFTRPAAQAVTGATLRDLSRLVNKSFLQFNKQRDRYQVHELLRQYGAERLGREIELERGVYDRHSTYYCQALANHKDDLKGARQQQALSAIEADFENVQLAWNHVVTRQDLRAIGISIETLFWFYWNVVWYLQGINEFEKAAATLRTDKAIGERGVILGRMLALLAWFYDQIGQSAKAMETAKESLDLLQRLGAREQTLMSLLCLARHQESREESNRLLQESLSLAREIGNDWAIGHTLYQMGANARAVGCYEQAELRLSESLKQFEENGDKLAISWLLDNLGRLAGDRGRYEEALDLALEANSILRENNIPVDDFIALGKALFNLKAYQKAEEQLQQGLSFFREMGYRSLTFSLLYQLGKVAFCTGDYVRATQRHQESLAGAIEIEDLLLVAQNHTALGRLNIVQGASAQARVHFQTALQVALSLERPPIHLAVLAAVAELFAEEGDLAYAALLVMLITNHPASQAKIKERAARLLTRLEAELSANDLANIRQRSRQSDLNTVAAQLLLDLKSA